MFQFLFKDGKGRLLRGKSPLAMIIIKADCFGEDHPFHKKTVDRRNDNKREDCFGENQILQ